MKSIKAGESTNGVDATLVGGSSAEAGSVGGTITDTAGTGVGGVIVDLFTATADGSRGQYLRSVSTDADGGYEFRLPPGCIFLTAIAPEGMLFDNGRRWFQPGACIEAGVALTGLDTVLLSAG